MATRYLEHLTQDGDRWDLLAWQYYGDATAYAGIIGANAHAGFGAVLGGGIRLLIPVIEAPMTAAPAGLPPWKRAGA